MKIRIKPAKDGAKIPKPSNGKFLHEEGELVLLDKFWRRRLLCGDVVEVKTIKKKTVKKITKKSEDE